MTRDPNAPEPLVSSAEDGELRVLLEAGRDELPNEAQLNGLAAKLGPILGPGGPGGGHGGGGGAAAAAKTAAGGTIAKLLGAVTLTVVVAGGAVHSLRNRATSDATPTMQSTSAVLAAATVENAAPSVEPPTPAPTAPPAVVLAPRAVSPAPRPVTSAMTPAEDPDAEVKLLQDAHGALSSDPARTLALCAEHARRFPDGTMAQEREVLAIEALAKTGRMDDARARADRFAAKFPSSTHLRRIHAVLGDDP